MQIISNPISQTKNDTIEITVRNQNSSSLENKNISLSWDISHTDVPASKPPIPERIRSWLKNEPSINQNKRILNNVVGNVKSGTLLAIMGASGAGKSTLLKILAGCPEKTYDTKGVIMVNNEVMNYKARKNLAFIQQDDIFIGALSVRQHLDIQAGLRMPNTTRSQRNIRVEEILFQLSLLKCQNIQIGVPGLVQGLSGGELRRLSIATELLRDPNILFADEPTSGLDSFMAKNIVTALRKLADSGKIVICTIHQPSSETFQMFDQLYLLANGTTVYSGPSKDALTFFTKIGYPCPINYNPADHYIAMLAVVPGEETECCERIEKFIKEFKTNSNKYQICDDHEDKIYMKEGVSKFRSLFMSPSKITFFRQFYFLLWRANMSIIKYPGLAAVKFVQSIVISVMIGLIFLKNSDGSYNIVENYNGALFLSVTNTTFSSILNVIFVFPLEFAVFYREKRKGLYRTSAYFISRTLADFPLNLLAIFIFCAIYYYMIGFYNDVKAFFRFFLVILLISETSRSWGFFISSITSSIQAASTLSTPLMLPFLIVGGLFVRDDTIPAYFIWLKYLSWFKYGYEALIINQYQYITGGLTVNNIPNQTGLSIINVMGYNRDNFFINCGILFALMIAFRIIAMFFLIIRSNF